MSLSEHQASVQRALKAGDHLGALFGHMGGPDHPRGKVLSAYREARKAIDPTNVRSARETLRHLRVTLSGDAYDLLAQASESGLALAVADVAVYADLEDVDPEGDSPEGGNLVVDALAAWLATLDAQIALIYALIASGLVTEGEILGDGAQAGLLTPFPFIRDGARWIATVLDGARAATLGQAGAARQAYVRQVVAVIDERVTPCCLNAHGQVQPFGKAFITSYPPAYANEQMALPFHHYCRSAIALVRAVDAGDELTQQMQDAADTEKAARAANGRQEIHPANATSRRGG